MVNGPKVSPLSGSSSADETSDASFSFVRPLQRTATLVEIEPQVLEHPHGASAAAVSTTTLKVNMAREAYL